VQLLGGAGGGLVYYAVDAMAASSKALSGLDPSIAIGLAAIISVAVFFINSVTASYNIGGTIEGFHDPKFKRLGTGIIASAIVSIVSAIFIILMLGGF